LGVGCVVMVVPSSLCADPVDRRPKLPIGQAAMQLDILPDRVHCNSTSASQNTA
jgi:hypothetical protein